MDEDTKLIATKASYHNLVSDDAPETGCHGPQHLITNPVSVKIVHRFEVIEIDYENSTAFGTRRRLEPSQLLQE